MLNLDIFIYKYRLTTFDNNNKHILCNNVYEECRLNEGIKDFNNQVALHHNIDGDNVSIILQDIESLAVIKEYDTEFDNT